MQWSIEIQLTHIFQDMPSARLRSQVAARRIRRPPAARNCGRTSSTISKQLDDVIFAAIDGDQSALQHSAAAWHRAVKTLGHDTIEETRRQYLRHAQSVWEELRHQSVQPPHKIFAAIEIIGLLVNSER